MSDWTYQGHPYEHKDGPYGFVYRITNTLTGRQYIGRKVFNFRRKHSVTLKNGKKAKRVRVTESDWRTYYGSCKQLLADVAQYGEDNFTREILSLHSNNAEMQYAELVYQVFLNVLDENDNQGNPLYYNENIHRQYHPASSKYRVERLHTFNRARELLSG